MSWFSKKLKKVTKVLDPAGAKIRENSGGSYGDPLNWYDSGPKKPIPYQAAPKKPLMPDPGTGGGTTQLGGGGGGRSYQPNPFAQQMAQVAALRGQPPPPQANPMPGQGMPPPQSPQSPQMPQMGPGMQPQLGQNMMYQGKVPNMAF